MEELFNIILNNLRTVGLCLILLVLFRLADILFGIANAKKQSITFDLKKLLWGIFYTICFIIGLASFVTAISSVILPAFTFRLSNGTIPEPIASPRYSQR